MEAFIGISGMGRIGRLLIRQAFSGKERNFRVKAINAVYPADTIVHLLKYDSVHGRWDADIEVQGEDLVINGERVKFISERDPEQIPWAEMGIELVIDSTGKFNSREGAQKHLNAGAKRAIISAPGTDMDLTVVMGVNDNKYDPAQHKLLSAASCTTNCVAPVLKILDDQFTISSGWMTTIHAYTNDQRHMDNPHQDLRRARACTMSMIPTSTGVGKALVDVLPHLAKSIQGLAVRVPTPDVSLVDLTVKVAKSASLDEVQEAFRSAANGSLSTYVGYTEEPLVSIDFTGSDKSAFIDGTSLMVSGDEIKVLAWYDNEWAYACRVIDLAQLVIAKDSI